MITFACKEIKKEELIRCSFNLNKTEYNVLMFLLKNNLDLNAIDIAKNMNLERTTVQKAITGLLEKELVKRKQFNLDKGGYVYIYDVNDKKEIKTKIKQIISQWHKSVISEVDSW